ncbi:HMG1/2-like protein isoform X2 [Diospyros lotus]|uniref:HMG1/2-like protein isoform X2 n=1 Tax=Diospyros lotus TaxID=55363 RepID=UPI002255F4E5|nr:HMG1/2-like protein isoform X2 [Diospyros lotus]
MGGEGRGKKENNSSATRARGRNTKRVQVSDATLKRARDGSAFTSCEKCNKQVPVVLIDWHDCQMEAQIRRTLDTQMADQEKQSDSVAPEKKRAKSTAEPNPKKAKKEKKGKDPNAPKRPPTAFFLFMDEFRKTYKEANPDCKSVSMVAKEGGEKWKSMTDEVKKPYMDRAAELKEEYKKALQSENNAQGAADDGKCTEEKETKVETVASAAAAADDD